MDRDHAPLLVICTLLELRRTAHRQRARAPTHACVRASRQHAPQSPQTPDLLGCVFALQLHTETCHFLASAEWPGDRIRVASCDGGLLSLARNIKLGGDGN